jgi:hypothetical protein
VRHKLLAYADNINTVGENTDTIKKKTEALLHTSKDIGLKVNPEKTKYMLMSHYQKAEQKQSIKIVTRSFEDVAKFKCFRTAVTDGNYMHKEIKSRMNSGNASYHSIQSFVFLPTV